MNFIKDSGFPPGLVGVPSGTAARFSEFWDCMGLLQVPDGSGYTRIASPRIASNRNNIVRHALTRPEWEWVFFLDDDHVFPDDTLFRLLGRMYTTPGVDVLCALYSGKVVPFAPILFFNLPENADEEMGRYTYKMLTEARGKNGGLLRVAATGGAGVLIKKSVFARLQFPYYSTLVGKTQERGDDIGFCLHLQQAGIPLYCDVLVTLGHTNATTFWPQFDRASGGWKIDLSWGAKTLRLNAMVL